MDDLVRRASSLSRAMWNHRWLGVAVAWLVAALGATVVLNLSDKYMATARIYVDSKSILKPLMADLAVQPNVEQQVMMLSQTLISRPNIEQMIRSAKLDRERKTPQLSEEELIDWIIKNLEIKSTSLENMYNLTYRDTNPEMAKQVLQSVASFFVETRLGENRKDSTLAKNFIEGQLRVYEKKLQEAENRLKDFKLRHIDTRNADGKGSAETLAEVSSQLAKARLELREAEGARDAIERQLLGDRRNQSPDSSGSGPSVSIEALDERIETQEKNLDSLLQQYTEKHPDVIGARRLIRELHEQRRKALAEGGPGVGAARLRDILTPGNLGYQQLKVNYAQAEANVASLKARVVEYESRYKQISQAVKDEPQVEAEFAQLNRDYDVHKKNYETLVARRESASLSSELESAPGVNDFKLIDPPRASPKPVAPNRRFLLVVVLLLALGAGGMASLAASRVRPAIFDPYALRETTDVPMLGCVSLVESESFRRRERSDLKRYCLAVGSLIGAISIGLFVVS